MPKKGEIVMPKRKRKVMIDEDKKNKKQNVSPPPSPPYLPDELVLENIVIRLSARDVARFTSVCKSWHDYIVNKTGFAFSHIAHHRNNMNLCFNLFNVLDIDIDDAERSYFFNLKKARGNNHFYKFKLLSKIDSLGSVEVEPVGNCNGLACVKRSSAADGFQEIYLINPVRRNEALILTCLTPEIGGGGGSLEYLCHGFGFDSLSQAYKVVLIYTTSTKGGGHQGFICMVFTLGVRSWRKIVTSTCDILPPPGCSPFPSQMMTTMWKNDHTSATICGGDLVWRITNNTSGDSDKDERLLLFDIHNERIQFIRLPDGCNSLIQPMMNGGDLETAHHLLEFEGYPCVARSEKKMINKGIHEGSSVLRFSHYHFEVHLYILKDKIKQIWIEEETFDATLKENTVPGVQFRNPFIRYFSAYSDQLSRPTRMFSFCDQVILYWFDGGCLIFYNLQRTHHNVAKGLHSGNKQTEVIFEAKMMTGITPDPDFGEELGDTDSDCPCIDYQLHAQMENIISLKIFIPKGVAGEFVCYEEFRQFVRDIQPVGWVDTGKKTPKWYAFF